MTQKNTICLYNIINIQKFQVRYELYDPTIQRIQVLRLEKRLDDKLYYLRDALPEYSTFPVDMDPEILPEGTPVPLNPVQVQQNLSKTQYHAMYFSNYFFVLLWITFMKQKLLNLCLLNFIMETILLLSIKVVLQAIQDLKLCPCEISVQQFRYEGGTDGQTK